MPGAALTRLLLLACLGAALSLPPAAAGSPAEVETSELLLRADAELKPEALPRRGFAPVAFEGFFSLAGRGGQPPPALRRAVIDFDRDGRLGVGGLARCRPERVEALGTRAARRACRSAIVGRGRIEAVILLAGGPVPVASALTVFNGPRLEGRPTALLHARIEVPFTQTHAILVPIRKRRGEFRYRVVLDVPPLAAGLGRLTRIEVDLGRRYRAGGKRRSYLSARCSDSILRTRGRFTFADGTVIDGALEKFCRQR